MTDYISFHPGYMNDCARYFYGQTAKAINTNGHAYGWCAQLPDGSQKPLDLQGFADAVFGGPNKIWRVILTNLGADGWWFHNPYNNDYTMQPVMIIPNELLGNIPLINRATGRYESNWRYVQKWLRQANDGRTFTQASRTQLLPVPFTAEQLRQKARDTALDGKRFDLLYWSQQELLNRYKRLNPNIIYACALYTSDSDQAEDYGSAATSNTLILSSDNTSIEIADPPVIRNQKRAAYDMAHEYLHTLGLHHTDESQGPNWKRSVMIWGEPPEAELTDYEKNKLRPSPHLKG
jgi:hypothetical protein